VRKRRDKSSPIRGVSTAATRPLPWLGLNLFSKRGGLAGGGSDFAQKLKRKKQERRDRRKTYLRVDWALPLAKAERMLGGIKGGKTARTERITGRTDHLNRWIPSNANRKGEGHECTLLREEKRRRQSLWRG